jgi:hypothetical protein
MITVTKRRKELARKERREQKAQKRARKKLEKRRAPVVRHADLVIRYDADGLPQGLEFHDF